MLQKAMFLTDAELNQFFETMVDKSGNSIFHMVKFVVSYNPFSKRQEYHLIYSLDAKFRNGMHLQPREVR